MPKKKNSDQTLTEEVSVEVPDEIEESIEEKVAPKSGLFGIIAIVSAFVLISVTLANPFNSNGQFHFQANTNLTLELTLTSQEFLTLSNKNVCDGVGGVSGIKNSTAVVRSSKLSKNLTLGSGRLNIEGKCEYILTIPTPESFAGGIVNFSFKFPFAETTVFDIDVGVEPPYKKAVISISLD